MTEELSIEGVDWRGAADTSLRLESGHVSGSGGINRLMGDYTLTDELLCFGVLATTMMAGPPERMEAEQRFLGALARVARWSIADEPEAGLSLVLAHDDGVELVRFVAAPSARPGDPPKRPLPAVRARERAQLDQLAVKLEARADHAGAAQPHVLAEPGRGADFVDEAGDPLGVGVGPTSQCEHGAKDVAAQDHACGRGVDPIRDPRALGRPDGRDRG